jgi:hypothetical protein
MLLMTGTVIMVPPANPANPFLSSFLASVVLCIACVIVLLLLFYGCYCFVLSAWVVGLCRGCGCSSFCLATVFASNSRGFW